MPPKIPPKMILIKSVSFAVFKIYLGNYWLLWL